MVCDKDGLLSNLNHIAQIGLFCLAVFGYFYTVKPLYSKALLEEEIAKKEIELNGIKKDINVLTSKVDVENKELITVKALGDRARQQLDLANKQFEQAKKQLVQAKQEIASKEIDLAISKKELQDNYENVKPAILRAVKEDISICLFQLSGNSLDGAIKDSTTCVQSKTSNSIYLNKLNEEDKRLLESSIDNFIANFLQGAKKIVADNEIEQKQLNEQLEVIANTQKSYSPGTLALKEKQIETHYGNLKKISKLFEDGERKISFEK